MSDEFKFYIRGVLFNASYATDVYEVRCAEQAFSKVIASMPAEKAQRKSDLDRWVKDQAHWYMRENH